MYIRVSMICQEGKMESYKLASLLLNIRGISITSAAKSCSLNASAVAGWLKGVPGRLSQEKQNVFLGYLGVSGGTLASDRVHFWSVKSSDLLPLARILNWSGGHSYEICYLSSDIRAKDFIDFQTAPLLIRSSRPPLKIVFRHTPPILLPTTKIEQVDPILVKTGITKWRDIPKKTPDSWPFIKVDRAVYDKVTEGGISIEEFDQIWNSVKTQEAGRKRGAEEIQPSSWEDFIYWAEEMGISPEEAQKCILESHREE